MSNKPVADEALDLIGRLKKAGLETEAWKLAAEFSKLYRSVESDFSNIF